MARSVGFTETDFVKKIMACLTPSFTKIHGHHMQAVGLPDIIGCFAGTYVGIEVKVRPYKLTEIQKRRMGLIYEDGGLPLEIAFERGIVCCYFWHRQGLTVESVLLKQFPISMLSRQGLADLFFCAESHELRTNLLLSRNFRK